MQLRKIKVYGKLRKFLGKTYFEAAVSSPQQAFNFLKANFEGVEKHMNQQIYKVKMNGRVIAQEFISRRNSYYSCGGWCKICCGYCKRGI